MCSYTCRKASLIYSDNCIACRYIGCVVTVCICGEVLLYTIDICNSYRYIWYTRLSCILCVVSVAVLIDSSCCGTISYYWCGDIIISWRCLIRVSRTCIVNISCIYICLGYIVVPYESTDGTRCKCDTCVAVWCDHWIAYHYII